MPYDQHWPEVNYSLTINDFARARLLLEEMLKENTEDPAIYFFLSSAYYGLNELNKALECCQIALEKGYKKDHCYSLLAEIRIEQCNYLEAKRLLVEALSIKPNMLKVLAVYGLLMLKTGHDEEAMRLFTEALEIDPFNESSYKYKSSYELSKGTKNTLVN